MAAAPPAAAGLVGVGKIYEVDFKVTLSYTLIMIKEANIISLKDFRLSTTKYINRVKKGENFTVLRKNEPVFMITLPKLYDLSNRPVPK